MEADLVTLARSSCLVWDLILDGANSLVTSG